MYNNIIFKKILKVWRFLFRNFLRLGSPLCCNSGEERSDRLPANFGIGEAPPLSRAEGGAVPLTRIKTLVSMTTPRDWRVHGTSVMPPFVEFDMSWEGFGCLYLPSIAPQSLGGSTVVGSLSNDTQVIGGIGSGRFSYTTATISRFSTIDKFAQLSIYVANLNCLK